MREAGARPPEVARAIVGFDSHGLIHSGRELDEPFKREFALDAAGLAAYGLEPTGRTTPLEMIRAMRPTVLVGATAQAGVFSQAMIEEMARHVERPIVLPLSNPTSRAECTPKDALAWSEGRAIVATGSPFEDVIREGERHVIGQANNVFIFPGLGLGAIVSGAQEISDEMFSAAARTLADCVGAERLATGAIFPSQDDLRAVSFRIACAVVRCARDANLGRAIPDSEVEESVRSAIWYPSYVPIVAS
jgi:malic enzyme